ncbi:MAG: glycosyltransferase family 8 protein [Alphaproteobacteria bacterium]|nr:glycosyltransferase family 8 protein [Alphaproteobacteria bacterium]
MNNKKKILIALSVVICVSYLSVSKYIPNVFNKSVNIAYYTDANYLPYMMTSLYSAIKNKNKDSIYNVYVVAKDFNDSSRQKLNLMASKDVMINIVEAREKTLDYNHLGRFSSFRTAMQKIFISDYLKDVDKVLYLDADTLVQQDLTQLYNKDISGKYLAATKDGLMYQFPEHITEIGLDWRRFYFNSGVMLLNLKQMRTDNIVSRAIRYFNSNQEVFGDQDILNVVVGEKLAPLSYLYNCNSTFFEEKDAEFLSEFYEETVYRTTREVYDNATILHFAGHKPWTEWFTHSYLKPLWHEYNKEMITTYNIKP